MDFMPLRLNSSSLTSSICALAVIIFQVVAMECQKLHTVDSPIVTSSWNTIYQFSRITFEILLHSMGDTGSTLKTRR